MADLKIHLPDWLETIWYQSQVVLTGKDIKQYTPLGFLFLLALDPVAGPQLSAVTGIRLEEFIHEVETDLKRRYAGRPHFSATQEVVDLLDQTVREANSPNTANVGHVVLAVFTMRNATTDAYVYLSRKGVTEAKVRESIARGVPTIGPAATGQVDIEKLTTDAMLGFDLTRPVVEWDGFGTQAQQVLACLLKRDANNVLVYGMPGSGRRTLVRRAIEQITGAQKGKLRGYRVRQVNPSEVSAQDAQALIKNPPSQVVFYIYGLKIKDLATWQGLFESKAPVIAVVTTADHRAIANELAGLVESFEIKEPDRVATGKVVEAQLQHLLKHHQLGAVQIEADALDLLIKHGPAITGLVNPGGAVQLADFVASYDALVGDHNLTLSDVAAVVADRTGVPVTALTRSEAERLSRLPQILERRVIGHVEAKQALQRVLKRARTGMRDPKRPIGTFFFLGPTGVGKTEMGKALAEFLFDNEEAIIRIDMSEYQEPHTVARLIGSPPGYVGYDEGGQLTNALRRNPYSVVMFDEVDKAHPDVLNALLQLLDEGRMTDGRGNTVDARHTIIILTSNHGSALTYQAIEAGTDPVELERQTREWLWHTLRPEFLNRFDEILYFRSLSEPEMAQILDLHLQKRIVKCFQATHGLKIEITADAKVALMAEGYDPKLGARNLIRTIERRVLDPINDLILDPVNPVQAGERVVCDRGQNGLEFTRSIQ